MAIVRTTNPVDDSEIVLVKGVIQQINFKEIENDKFGNTHRASVRIDDDWINNISLKVKEGFDPEIRINTGSRVAPKWENIGVGDDVRIVVTESEYNSKTYYNSGTSKITLISKGQGVQQTPVKSQGASSSNTYAKKDDTPIVAGNARTAAAAWLSRFDGVDFKEMITFFAEVSHKARIAVKGDNPDMSDFEVGVATGQGTVIAAQLCEQQEDVYDFIIDFVNDVVPYSVDVVKGLTAPKQEPATKKTVAKKTATKKEATPEPVDDSEIPDSAFDDMDSLPF